MALIAANLAAALDEGLVNVTHVLWSENGSSESANVARTAVTLKSATSANPSVKSNDGALESAAASSGCTITHFAFGATATPQTTWIELDSPAVLLAGGKITVADGALAEKLYQATAAPA
jgi:hypothetical protein